LKALQHPPAGGTKLLDLHWVAFALSTNQARAFVFATSRIGTTDKPKDILSERRDEGGFGKTGSDSILSTTGRGATGRTCIISPFY
jgi:hypothetical protein